MRPGNKLSDSPYPVNPAGFVIHSAIHAARHDALCVLHTHTVAGVAVSAQKDGLLPISQQATVALASLGYHDYEGIAVRDDEKPRLQRDLGNNTCLILRNHGLLTVGGYRRGRVPQHVPPAARLRGATGWQAGGAPHPVDPRITAGVKENVHAVTRGLGGALAWPGLLRKLDRQRPGYAD